MISKLHMAYTSKRVVLGRSTVMKQRRACCRSLYGCANCCDGAGPTLTAKGALLLLLSRYGGHLSNVPPPLVRFVSDAERHSISFSFLGFLNSPIALSPPQWRVRKAAGW